MKKLINYFIMSWIAILICSCSKNFVKIIEHDYNKNTNTYTNKAGDVIDENKVVVKEGDKVKVKVKNYNPLSIDATASKVKGTLNYQQNNSSTLLGFLSAGNKAKDETTDEGNPNAMQFPKPSEVIESRNIGIQDTLNKYKQFYNEIASLNNYIEGAKTLSMLDKECLCKDLEVYTDNIKKLFITPDHKPASSCEGIVCKNLISGSEIRFQRDEYFKLFNSLLSQLDKLKKKQKDKYDNDKKGLNNEKENEIKEKTKGKSEREIVKIKEEINKKYGNIFNILGQKNEDLIKVADDLVKAITDLKDDYLTTRANTIDLAVNKYQALGFIEFEKNLGTFSSEEEDNFSVTINFTNSAISKNFERSIDLDVVKPLKIDYSVGVFVAPYLFDESFDVVKKTDTTYTINSIDHGKTSYGAIGYINFHPIFCNRWFSIGGSVGTGLMFNDATKIVFSPALSFFVGRYQRVVASFGGAFAQVDRIHSLYPNNEFKDASYKPELKKEISSSFIFSLTWNLSRK